MKKNTKSVPSSIDNELHPYTNVINKHTETKNKYTGDSLESFLKEEKIDIKPEPEVAIKHDTSKVRMELLSPIALTEISKVLTFGANKYAEHNWRKGFKWSRLLGATLRHLFAFIGGQDKDPETGLSHLAHAGCCLLFLLEHEVTHKNLDDRYKYENNS